MVRVQLLLLLAVVAISASFVIAQDESDESKPIEKIELLGGKIERDDKLPNHDVVGVSLVGSERFNDKFIHLLKAFKNVAKLDVSGTTITDEGLKQISELKGLTDLYLFETSVTVAGVAELRTSSPKLRVFEQATSLQSIKELGGKVQWEGNVPGRREVNVFLHDNLNFGDEHVHLLVSLKNVKMLQLQNTKITDAGLKELKELQNLTVLILFGNQITDEGLKELKELKNLDSLWLGSTKITDNGLKELIELQNLSQLDLFESQITDAGLKAIGELKNLSVLNLGSSQITDVGLKELSKLDLVRLDLVNTKVTDLGLNEINVFKKLHFVNLRGTRITDAGLMAFKDMMNIGAVFLGNTQVTDAGMKELKKSLPNVQISR